MGVPELEKQISEQGLKVKELKTNKADPDTIKAEVAVLLKLKQVKVENLQKIHYTK